MATGRARGGQATVRTGGTPDVRPERDDTELLKRCRAGDASAWEALIRRYRRLIYSIPFACGLGADAADDIFSRVTLLLFQNVPKLRDPARLPAWLVITTRRECWAMSREASRFKGFEDGQAEAIPEDPPDVAGALDRIRGEHALAVAFEKLAPPCRQLLQALYLEDPRPSHAELARRLGRPIGSLGPTHGRCLAKLRKLYEAEGGEAPWKGLEP